MKNTVKSIGVATLAILAASQAQAAIDVTAAVASVGDATAACTAVLVAMITVGAVVWGFKKVKSILR